MGCPRSCRKHRQVGSQIPQPLVDQAHAPATPDQGLSPRLHLHCPCLLERRAPSREDLRSCCTPGIGKTGPIQGRESSCLPRALECLGNSCSFLKTLFQYPLFGVKTSWTPPSGKSLLFQGFSSVVDFSCRRKRKGTTSH